MNSWLVWGGFALAVVFLGWVAYHFTVRTLRFVTLALMVAGVVLVTRYGVAHSSRPHKRHPSIS
jgi:multidrug transporter EmrE-like cation transporter